jgi:hypothetical protein
VAFGFLAVLALGVATLPWLLWRLKAYQHSHYALGPLQTDFRASLKSFYVLTMKPIGLMVGLIGAIGLVVWGVLAIRRQVCGGFRALFTVVPLVIIGIWLLFFLGIRPGSPPACRTWSGPRPATGACASSASCGFATCCG